MVKIVQLLCPQRHCLMGVAYQEELETFEKAKSHLQALLKEGVILDYCALCGSKELRYEEGTTKFKTLKEAAPSLATIMAEQLATRKLLDEAGLTYNKMPENRPDLN